MHIQAKKSKNKIATILLHQVGVIVGFIVIWLLAVYEGEIAKVGGGDHH
jgi:predicted membrane channel-forming protein YqfA (hemolysin III family)